MTGYHVEVPTLLRRAGALREIRQVRREEIRVVRPYEVRPYEIMVIFDPTLEEQAIQQRIDESTQLIEARGGDLGRVEQWGKRRLAYEINHQRDGYYVLIGANAEPETMSELTRSLQLADDVLRHKIVRIPDKVAEKVASGTTAPPGAADVAAAEAAGETSINSNGEQNDG